MSSKLHVADSEAHGEICVPVDHEERSVLVKLLYSKVQFHTDICIAHDHNLPRRPKSETLDGIDSNSFVLMVLPFYNKRFLSIWFAPCIYILDSYYTIFINKIYWINILKISLFNFTFSILLACMLNFVWIRCCLLLNL